MEKQFKYIGPLIKEARQKLEMTQEQLAKHIGVTAR
ncbi:helix-turn-helix domain-containing protein [Enterocloster bolteae]|jgi:DNA-binding XRE family transcriptional regulator|nr:MULTISPECIES: helix-turn-helix transcriptional regulator [Clostridia]MCB7090169.1 helix-turn-helix domain-containing protein [Enterocloster bolteae]MCH1935072.1 helix-turn-helix domain-containing protein [Enterocloster sp. OA11]